MLSLTMCVGCSFLKQPTTLYMIEGTDIYENEAGDICMSKFYVDKVLEAKIESKQ